MNPTSIVFLSAVSYAFGGQNCPSYEEIGCRCGKSSSITCQNWDDMDKVAGYMDRLALLQPMTFNLKDVFLPALPAGLFRNTRFIDIHFDNVSLPFLGPPVAGPSPFSGLEKSLQEFRLTNVSYLYNWDWSLLSRLADLLRFKVRKSKVLRIDRNFSSISASLRFIEMVDCQITWIEDGAFASFVSLGDLLLNKNRIASFKRSYLPHPAQDLTVINLSENCLTELEEDLFDQMPELKVVSVERNRLTTVPATIAQRMSIFRGFRINGNPFECHCHLTQLCRGGSPVDAYDQQVPTCTADGSDQPLPICHLESLLNCR